MARLEDHGTSGGEQADAVDHCLAGIARLSNEVKDASSYIPPYDQRTYGEAIKALSTKLQEARSTFAPRPRFAFKGGANFTKKNASAISLGDAAELAAQKRKQLPGYVSDLSNDSSFATTPADRQSPAPEKAEPEDAMKDSGYDENNPVNKNLLSAQQANVRKPSFSQSASVSINNHEGLHIILPSSAANATSSGTLSNLRRCVVDMSVPTASGRPFAGLTLKNIKESLIVCGHVNGAAHITNVSDSTIVVASRQFRMHESCNCDVYLLTTSRPIIEDCSKIHFAPLPTAYVLEGDEKIENQWQQVDDFKWLKPEPSPNWSMLDMPHRVRDQVWHDVVPGGPELGTEDILRALNLPKS